MVPTRKNAREVVGVSCATTQHMHGQGLCRRAGAERLVGESEIMHGRLQQANAISMIAPAVRLRLRFYQHGAPQVRHTARPNDKTELLDNF